MPNEELIQLDPNEINNVEWITERDAMLLELSEIESVESDSELTAAGKLQTSASKLLKKLDKLRTAAKKPSAGSWPQC